MSEATEIYAVYVQTIRANEQRRQTLSAVYVSLLAAIAALLASDLVFDAIWAAIAPLAISILWFLSVSYFRKLASAKFAVVNRIEANFDVKPFELEWQIFKGSVNEQGEAVEVKKRLFPYTLTHFDMATPIAIGLVSFGYIVFRMLQG